MDPGVVLAGDELKEAASGVGDAAHTGMDLEARGRNAVARFLHLDHGH